jgi:hypothetical protein
VSGSAHALDGSSVEIGFGNEHTETARVGLQWKWDRRWLEGRAWAWVETVWVMPEDAARHTLHAVIDPDGAVLEFDEGNNSQGIGIGGVDLEVSLRLSGRRSSFRPRTDSACKG